MDRNQLPYLILSDRLHRDDRIISNNLKLEKPKDLTQVSPKKLQEEEKKASEIAQEIGRKKLAESIRR